MKQKPLELLTKDAIRLDHVYQVKDPDSIYTIRVTPFNTKPTVSCYVHYKDAVVTYYKVLIRKPVKVLGYTVDISILTLDDDISSKTTLGELSESHPAIYKELMRHYDKSWLPKANEILQSTRDTYIANVDKLYNEMMHIHSELGYKTDVATLTELDDLLYCEAEGFLMKMHDKINKKNNPKNLKLYKALQAYRGDDAITCTSD